MITVNVRKQGGAAVVTVPAEVLKLLNIEVGSKLELNVSGGVLTARPTSKSRRYSLSELMRGVTRAKMARLNSDIAWSRKGRPVGREIA